MKISLGELAKLTDSVLKGDPSHLITGVADLASATSSQVSFLANPKYLKMLGDSQAGGIFIEPSAKMEEGKNYLLTKDPSQAFQKAIDYFSKEKQVLTKFSNIHKTAVIHESAKLEEGVSVGPQAVIDGDVTIGKNTKIGALVFIGPNVKIGKNCIIHPNVVIREYCQIGDGVIIQPGACIGSCGFGYITDTVGKHQKLNQAGNVIIEDEVEIGANTTIDRARFHSTRIGRGAKIDNLVQIAHGVEIGEGCIIVSQAGIAGSTKLGKWVILGGQVGVAGHIELGDQVMIAAKSGISKSLLKKGKYGGIPAVPLQEYNRTSILLRKLLKSIDQK